MDKYTQNIEKQCNVSLKLIRQAANEKWVKPLAFWHSCKATYGNSAIYNYRSRMAEIALKHGISTKTLYKYVLVLRERELVSDFQSNLALKSIRQIKHEYSDNRKTQIFINQNDTIWHIECRLYAKLIESHVKKMAFKEALKRFGIRNSHKTEQSATLFQPSLSVRNIAKLLNINEKTAIKIMDTLVLLGVLEVQKTKAKKLSDEKLPIEMLSDFPGYLFITQKGTFQMFGNIITLIEYPATLPKITPKIYAKNYKSN